MKNLSEDERRDIDDLVSDLSTEENIEPAEKENATNGSNGEALPVDIPSGADADISVEEAQNPDTPTEELIKLITLQNDRLGILNKKVDVLTRLVELILRANLEDID